MKSVKTKDYRAFGRNVGLALKDTLGYLDKKKVTNVIPEEDDESESHAGSYDNFDVDLSEDEDESESHSGHDHDKWNQYSLNGIWLVNLEDVPVSK